MDIKVGLQEIGWWGEVWTGLIWLRAGTGRWWAVLNVEINVWVL